MKPAEIVTVAIAIPMIAALFAATVAEGRDAASKPVTPVTPVAQAVELPGAFDQILVVAKRPART